MWQKIITMLGWIVLAYAGMSFRNHSKDLLEMNLDVPHTANVKVFVQLAVGFFMILVGRIANLKLKNIRVSPDIRTKPMAELFGRADFMVFNHRGRAIEKRLATDKK